MLAQIVWRDLRQHFCSHRTPFAVTEGQQYNQAIAGRPSWFRHDQKFWSSWYNMYDLDNDIRGVITRFRQALSTKEGDY